MRRFEDGCCKCKIIVLKGFNYKYKETDAIFCASETLHHHSYIALVVLKVTINYRDVNYMGYTQDVMSITSEKLRMLKVNIS